MKNVSRLIMALAVIFLAGIVPGSQAQTEKGSVAGRVTDPSGGVLQGAEVEIQPTGATKVTNNLGEYYITNLPPGTFTITVTYVGFSLFTQVVKVTAGQTASVNVKMDVAAGNDQVIVTAERASGEAEALNRERNADNELQVLPAEVIRSLPNANMADAIGRLPSVTLERDEGEGKYVQIRGTEPRLTNATVDGVTVPSPESGVRQLKFDTIPADLVESVEINKTMQANQDGDGIGGSVNMITKQATERPTISLYGLGGVSPIQGGRTNYETTATIGKRFLANKKLGALIGFSYDWNGRGIDDIEPVPDIATNNVTGATQRYFVSQDIREYAYYRSRWGLGGTVDYKLSEGSDIYVRGLYSDFKNYGDRWVYSLTDNTQGISTLNGNGCSTDDSGVTTCTGAPSFNTQIRRPDYAIGSIVIGGKHVLATSWYNWDVSVSRAREIENGYGTGSFGVPTPSTYTGTCTFSPALTKDIYRPQWSPACYTEAYNTSNLALNDLSLDYGKTAQLNLQFTGAMAKRYHLGSHLANIEIGGRFRNAHKYDHTYTNDYAINTDENGDYPNAAPISQFSPRVYNTNYYNNSYPLGPVINFRSVNNFVLANADQFAFTSGAAGNPNFYNYVEQVSAGYVMNTIDFGKFRFIAGVRIEGTNLNTLSWQTGCTDPTVCTTIIPAGFDFPGGGSYIKVLPSASLRYAVTSNTNIRVVYSRTFSRPDPQDIAQSFSVSLNGANTSTVSLGNPTLKAETSNNYDLLFEHYLNPFGAITAGFFYKDLGSPIVTTSQYITYQPTPQYPLQRYLVTQPVNIGSGHVTGFEISYLQRFSSLPNFLSGLGLSANYSYTASQANGLYDRQDTPRLLRQAPNTWNISPTYDRGRLSIRVGLSYNGESIYSYQYQDGSAPGGSATPGGIKGPLSDTYFYPHFQVDAQGSFRLNHGFNLIAYGLNLNNEVFGFYNGSSQYMIQREYYTPTFALGLRWSPTHEK